MLFLMILAVGTIILAAMIFSGVEHSAGQAIDLADRVASTHKVIDVVSDGTCAAGIDPSTGTLVVVGSDGSGHRFNYDHVASVELTPVYEHHDVGTSTTKVGRGSQLVSAGIGAAIAGPAGLVVGGLTGSKSTAISSVQTTELDRIELRVRLHCDDLPVFRIVASRHALGEVERFAARLTNVIEKRNKVPENIAKPLRVETILERDAQLPGQLATSSRKGWWARTFYG
jgi:hypothetical protein